VQTGEDELAAQSRLTRELQDDLLRTRLVEFDSIAERLHRVVRQAARHRQAGALEISGGQIELDRSVLERMAGPSSTCCATAWRTASRRPSARAAGKDRGHLRIDVASRATRCRSSRTTAPA
jgi:chemosensory pili system protein ChpA (sensor histidine kinase/response regulator)